MNDGKMKNSIWKRLKMRGMLCILMAALTVFSSLSMTAAAAEITPSDEQPLLTAGETQPDHGSTEKDVSGDITVPDVKDRPTTDGMTIKTLEKSASAIKPKSKAMKNTYVLEVATGVNAGDNVKYFGVRYTDKDGFEHTELLFPNIDAMDAGCRIAGEVDSQNARLNTLNRMGIIPKNYYTNQKRFKEEFKTLESDSYDMYLFQPDFEVKKINRVDVYLSFNSAKKKNQWTLNSMSLYKVDTLYGLKMYGYISNKYYIDFEGTLLARFDEKASLATNGADKCFRFAVASQKSRDSGTADCDYVLVEKNTKYASQCDNVVFRMDIADAYAAGIEALNNQYEGYMLKNLGDMGIVEPLTLRIKYRDVYGNTRDVEIPVISSYVGWLTEKYSSSKSIDVIGIAQQGESIVFEATLPDYDSMIECRAVFSDSAMEAAGITRGSGTAQTREYLENVASIRQKLLKSSLTNPAKPETLAFSSVSFYKSENAEITVKQEGARIRCDVKGTPSDYYITQLRSGESMEYGSNETVIGGFVHNDGGSVDLKPFKKWTYIVEIDTADIKNSGTSEPLYAKFRYLSRSGMEQESDLIKLRQASSEFYGYWSGSSGDYSYKAAVGQGSKLVFGLDLSDVDYFIGVTLSADEGCSDEWQVSQIKILRVSYVSDIYARWKSSSVDGAKTDREQFRIYDTDYCVRTYDRDLVLIHYGEHSKYIKFDADDVPGREEGEGGGGGTGGGTDGEKVDWNDIKESMSYEQTKKDLAFTHEQCSYTVYVKVEGDDGYDKNGDYGSTNKFYFKLVFENGCSGYVLANQQLSADGFRSGQTETFVVKTNRDYGELNAVYIIPEDTQDSSEPFDKLNINSIMVKNSTNLGIARTWMISEVGWIAIDYQDSGSQSTMGGQGGRTEAELARRYEVDSIRYMMDFVFAVKTDSYDPGYDPFEGTLTANIIYRDNKNVEQKMYVDVAEAMYEYMDKKVIRQSGSVSNSDVKGKALVDPSCMLRENTIDRFTVSLPDVTKIVRIEFQAYSPKKTTQWNIGSVDVFHLISEGKLQVNTNGEYQRSDTLEKLCSCSSVYGYKFFIPSGGRSESEYPISFNTNTITVDEGVWESTVITEKESYDDTLNIYVYMAKSADLKAKYTMSGTVTYKKRTNDQNEQTKIGTMHRSADGKMYYVTGLSAKALANAEQLTLKANSTNSPLACVDHAIIRHVRGGVVINSYYFDFGGADVCFSPKTEKPSSDTTVSGIGSGRQVVTMQFDDSTPLTNIASTDDIAVTLSYTTTNDPNNVMHSKAVTMSSQEIHSIKGGSVVKMTFNEDFVKDVKGISLQSIGGVSGRISKACVGTYTSDRDNNVTCNGWFSFTDGTSLSYAKHTMSSSAKCIVPLELSMVIANASGQSGEASVMPVKMTLKTLDSAGKEKTLTYDDVSPYVASGRFLAGETVTIKTLLTDAQTVRSVTLEPYDSTSNIVSVEISNICAKWTFDGTEYTSSRTANVNIYEGKPQTINLSNILVEFTGNVYDSDMVMYKECNSHTDGSVAVVSIKSGESIRLIPKLSGTLSGYGFDVKCAIIEGTVETPCDCCTKNGNFIQFSPPANYSGSGIKYKITVLSEENPESTASLIAEVTAAEKPADGSGSDV